jgi:hypothetical protein
MVTQGDIVNINNLSGEEVIDLVLQNELYTPCLILGKYIYDFKKKYQGKIFSVGTLEDVKYITDRFMYAKSLDGNYFVMDNVGFLNDMGQNSLLKFIEENQFPIVLLSYVDKVSPIIQSRMKFIFKKSIVETKNFRFMKLKDAISTIDDMKKRDKDFNEMDELKFYAENCPSAYMYKYSAGDVFNQYSNNRVLKMIAKMKGD